MGGTTLTRRKQLEASFSDKCAQIVKALVTAKVKSQKNFLASLYKDHPEKQEGNAKFSTDLISTLNGSIDDIRPTLLGIEGSAAAQYFKALGAFTENPTRNPRGNDIWNVCLNYAYGMLYAEVERACILAGLDPYLGFYHTDRYGKPSLVLDMTELFRVAIADRAVVTLLNRKQIGKKDFEAKGDRTLSRAGRKKIIEAVNYPKRGEGCLRQVWHNRQVAF